MFKIFKSGNDKYIGCITNIKMEDYKMTTENGKTLERKFEIVRNERELVKIYLRDFAERKLTKKRFIEILDLMYKNTDNWIS